MITFTTNQIFILRVNIPYINQINSIYTLMSPVQQIWGHAVVESWIFPQYRYQYCQGDLTVNQINQNLTCIVLFPQFCEGSLQ